jgi:uncharacterized protein YdeI (YjbR/CyaY-like superfamily)
LSIAVKRHYYFRRFTGTVPVADQSFYEIPFFMKPRFFSCTLDFHRWLAANHKQSFELWVGFYRKSSGKPSVSYPESVDAALCFGWIDGVRRSVTADAYTIRFSPRKPRSWSSINIKRAQELANAGRMQDAGRKAFEGAQNQPRKYSYEQRRQARFAPADERRFRANHAAWDFFQKQPPWYRRTATFWVISAKKEETCQRRLAALIADSERGKPVKPLLRPVPKRR